MIPGENNNNNGNSDPFGFSTLSEENNSNVDETEKKSRPWNDTEKELTEFAKERLELIEKSGGNLPPMINKLVSEKTEKLRRKIKEQQIEAVSGMLQPEKAASFREWAFTPESEFEFDTITDGICDLADGTPLEEVKENILSIDRGLGDEGNRKMGEVAFNRMMSFWNKSE